MGCIHTAYWGGIGALSVSRGQLRIGCDARLSRAPILQWQWLDLVLEDVNGMTHVTGQIRGRFSRLTIYHIRVSNQMIPPLVEEAVMIR
jgi:hypothetical protein